MGDIKLLSAVSLTLVIFAIIQGAFLTGEKKPGGCALLCKIGERVLCVQAVRCLSSDMAAGDVDARADFVRSVSEDGVGEPLMRVRGCNESLRAL